MPTLEFDSAEMHGFAPGDTRFLVNDLAEILDIVGYEHPRFPDTGFGDNLVGRVIKHHFP